MENNKSNERMAVYVGENNDIGFDICRALVNIDDCSDKTKMLELWENNRENSWNRLHFDPGHFTTSVFVCDKELNSVLLIHHKKLQMKLQPGGHIEDGDTSFIEAGKRELSEETGIETFEIEPLPFDVDIHLFPRKVKNGVEVNPDHFHFDIRYLARVDISTNLERQVEEIDGIEWVPVDKLYETTPQEGMRRVQEKLISIRDSSQ
ncbi:hypothetical protein PCE1_004173 [Barthelona sp. PCE]